MIKVIEVTATQQADEKPVVDGEDLRVNTTRIFVRRFFTLLINAGTVLKQRLQTFGTTKN